jgi:hypothetical protein
LKLANNIEVRGNKKKKGKVSKCGWKRINPIARELNLT